MGLCNPYGTRQFVYCHYDNRFFLIVPKSTNKLGFYFQVGFIGLVEEEWLVTLATIDREEVTYLDFVTEGTKLAKELRDEVRIRH